MQENNFKYIHNINSLPADISFNKEAVWQQLETTLNSRNTIRKTRHITVLLAAAALLGIIVAISVITFYTKETPTITQKILPNQSISPEIINQPEPTEKKMAVAVINKNIKAKSNIKTIVNQPSNIDTLKHIIASNEIIKPVKASIDSVSTTTSVIATTLTTANATIKANQLKKAKNKLAVVHINDLNSEPIPFFANKKSKAENIYTNAVEQPIENTSEPQKLILFFKVKPSFNNTLQEPQN